MNMNRNNEIPISIRVLRILGGLEGPGVILPTLIILAVILTGVTLVFQGYLGCLILILLIFLFVVYVPRRKRQFRTIKRRYGITKNVPYGLERLTRLILDFNDNSETILGIQDYTFIKIDGSPFPLIYGSVLYARIQTEGSAVRAIFLLVERNNFVDLALKYNDIFEIGGQQKEISVYWVKDLQRLENVVKGN